MLFCVRLTATDPLRASLRGIGLVSCYFNWSILACRSLRFYSSPAFAIEVAVTTCYPLAAGLFYQYETSLITRELGYSYP